MNTTRCFDFLDLQFNQNPLARCLSWKEKGQWHSFSTQEVKQMVDALSSGLIDKGIQPGDKIAIISSNRPEWVITDFAIQQIGAVSVPLYPNANYSDYEYAFEHAEVKLVFYEAEEIEEKVRKATGEGTAMPCYSFSETKTGVSWKELKLDTISDEIQERKANILPDNLFTIIYTSGTTGTPKGVMLSHNNVATNSIVVGERVNLLKGETRVLSFLPLCHVFERTAMHFYFLKGHEVYFAESLDAIGDNIREVRPHFFATVPRLLEKVYDKIINKGRDLKGVKKALFFWAVDLGLKYEPNVDQGFVYDLKLKIADKLIFSKWREALGGELQGLGSGAAALQPRLCRVFWAAGIKVLEAYGLTETSPGICVSLNDHDGMRIGSVGPALKDIEIRIAEDGEILCKGPNVMMGYYKDPERTAEVMDNGWFHTGDIGEIREGKYLYITDRKKEIFKTSGGKYIAPQVIENKLKESILIDNAMVIGENEKFPATLIVPAFSNLEEWSKLHKIDWQGTNKMLEHPEVIKKYQSEIDKVNENLGQWEKVKAFRLLDHEWSITGDELTPTLKLKRRIILDKNQDKIANIYLNK